MEWYYAKHGEQVGPISEAEMASLSASGDIAADTLVWHSGLEDWQAYGTLADPAAPSADGLTRCSECGAAHPESELIRLGSRTVCAACKPIAVQRLKEGVDSIDDVTFGGFWIRVAAKIVDGLVLMAPNLIITFAAKAMMGNMAPSGNGGNVLATVAVTGVQWLIQTGIGAAFTTFFLGKYGATPGKMLCHLKVIRSDGSPLTYGRAFGRHFADMINGFTCCLTYLMVAFDEERRGLHDRICDTRVIVT